MLLQREYMGPGMNCERILIENNVCNTFRAKNKNAYSSLHFRVIPGKNTLPKNESPPIVNSFNVYTINT